MTEYMHVTQYLELIKSGKAKPHVPGKKKSTGSKPKAEIEMVLKLLGVKYQTELKFHPKRRWRFDFAIESKMIAIEYEGVFNTEKSRHTTVSGYTGDAEKYNEAQKLGWKVLRYTAMNYKNITNDLKDLL